MESPLTHLTWKYFFDDILMEYLKGKELFFIIRDIGLLNKQQTQFYVTSIMIAINDLHKKNIEI